MSDGQGSEGEQLGRGGGVRGESGRNVGDASKVEDGMKEEKDQKIGQKEEEEEEDESDKALQGCSISHRKLTETSEEALERCVRSEEEETSKEGAEMEDESLGRAPPGASDGEEEVVEVFEAGPSLPAEAEPDGNTAELSSFAVPKRSPQVLDIKDLSGTISPFDKDEEGTEGGDETRAKATKSSEDKEPHKVDRLVLHLSTQSLSSSSDTERRSPRPPDTRSLAASPGLQRPETSRGRPGRTLDAPVGNTEQEKEDKREKEKEEERDTVRAEREERCMRQKEEEIRQEQERLRREAERAPEEEKEGLLKETRISLLQEELRRHEEEEERKLREESEKKLKELRQHLLSKRREEEARLNEDADKTLEQLRESIREEREHQQQKLREDSEAMLKMSLVALEEERAATRDRLEARKKQDMERLKAESEEELEATKRRLQREREEELSALKQEVTEHSSERHLVGSAERRRELIVSPRPERQLAEYHRELSDVLQEVRDEVQREHERKLEQLQDDHRREMNAIREKHLDEETAQRERLLRTLQEDSERLRASHDLQLEKLRLQLDARIQKTQLAHSRRESELRDLAEKLELREKELKSHEVLLQTKAADLNRRRKKLGEEEEELDGQLEALPRLLRERDELNKELRRLREEVAQAREISHRARGERDEAKEQRERMREERDRAREDRERLENMVALLQERCDRLTSRLTDQEQTEDGGAPPRSEHGRKKAETATAPPNDRTDSPLRAEELDDPPLSPVPDSRSSIVEFRQYVSSHGASVQRTKQFLERESSRLAERQAALHAVQTSAAQDPSLRGQAAERMRSIQQEARDVAELQRTVQRGASLLRRKEEQLLQLQSSMAEEALFAESPRLAGDRKVTFDVTESDLSSTAEPPDGSEGHSSVPAKVHELAESMQHISGQLNSVLDALGTLAQRENSSLYSPFSMLPPQPPWVGMEAWGTVPTSSPAVPLLHGPAPSSAAPPLAERLSEPLWSWAPRSGAAATPLFSTPISSGPTASAAFMDSGWSQIFPGAAADPRTTSSYPSYAPISCQATQKTAALDGQRLQGLIDSNKKWLNMRRKDPSIPLLTRYRPASSKNGLVQLGLDDNNQIRVYHY